MTQTRTLATVEDTEEFGRELAAELSAGDLVILDGPLGAGKTVLARGIAAGLGVRGPVTSPTYVIAREHPAGERAGADAVAMVHVDAYRLGDGPGALDELDAIAEQLEGAHDLAPGLDLRQHFYQVLYQYADRPR
ncbi:MAG: tRNA (adenosine(37)-N6)-threonylcarbamoyltransferase complex ATPase subunit type 1 TsaE, partial [Tomitella sp.]|nr:tRNA (adenosine(37)-N6)-threonylcarbamoyltransferase complex ATPase subunit type 1 TsaE [Tomitella sp.]